MNGGKVVEMDFSRKPVDPVKPLERAHVKGWVRTSFWALRIYILVMLVLVVVGFAKGTI